MILVLQTNALFRKEIRDRDRKKINFEAFYIPPSVAAVLIGYNWSCATSHGAHAAQTNPDAREKK